MEIKKYPNAALENYSKILIQLGLVLSLFIVYQLIKIKTYTRQVNEISGTFVRIDNVNDVAEVKIVKPIEQPKQKVVLPDKIIKVEDEKDVIETVIESTETDELDAVEVTNIESELETVEEEETVVEDVPFVVIEKVPIYPGCSGNNKELRACFSAKISKFVSEKFNSSIATDIGLSPGTTQKIFVMFKIDAKGNISDIKARATHKKLQAEAIRVIQSLPKMIPGEQRGQKVGVKYALPIVFKVQ